MEHNGKEKRGETGFRLLAQVWQFSLEPKERHEQARGAGSFHSATATLFDFVAKMLRRRGLRTVD